MALLELAEVERDAGRIEEALTAYDRAAVSESVAAAAYNPCGVNRCDPCGGSTSTFAPVGSGCSTCNLSSFESTSGGLSSDYPSPSLDPGYPAGYPAADQIMRYGTMLPCHPTMDDAQREYLYESLMAFITKNR